MGLKGLSWLAEACLVKGVVRMVAEEKAWFGTGVSVWMERKLGGLLVGLMSD